MNRPFWTLSSDNADEALIKVNHKLRRWEAFHENSFSVRS